jgi:hypothetical protein
MSMPDAHRRRLVLLAVALTALTGWTGSACGATAPSALPATVVLAPGQSSEVGQARLQLDRVVSDSRCPINALCIAMGETLVAVTFSVSGRGATDELSLVDPARRTVTRGGMVLEFTGLSPFPVLGQPIPPGDYRATFALSAER